MNLTSIIKNNIKPHYFLLYKSSKLFISIIYFNKKLERNKHN